MAGAVGYGFDAGQEPGTYVQNLEEAGITGRNGTWLRVRGVAGGGGEGAHAGRTKEQDRRALLALRKRGVRVCVIVRWPPSEWSTGVRPGGGHRMPLDLREAYERGRMLGGAYGDLVDVWEIDNEPDIGFVAENPETYAAFLKAVYLGLKSGAETAFQSRLSPTVKVAGRSAESTWRARKQGGSVLPLKLQLATSSGAGAATPRVVMAPLALPPGPYLERLWANGIASYTDGFNFHYYGYSGDFSGVYMQFRDAVRTLGATPGAVEVEGDSLRGGSGSELDLKLKSSPGRHVLRTWPVFITEYGYGLLDAEARNTIEGRVRQWQWFADVGRQLHSLRPEGPMAFVLNPYYEANLNEFGLTMAAQPELRSDGGARADEPRPYMDRGVKPLLQFKTSDFGAKQEESWMRRIGLKVGDAFASPALAWLWDYAERHPYRARDWTVRAPSPSPVVIDFIAGDDMRQMKSSGGYLLLGAGVADLESGMHERPVRTGRVRIILYNFSHAPVTGRLAVGGNDLSVSAGEQTLTLAPGERRELPLDLAVQARVFERRILRAVFIPEEKRLSSAVFATRLFPLSAGMTSNVVSAFDFPEEAARTRRTELLKRPLAVGEPKLRVSGRWLVTEGVRVEEQGDAWNFHIDFHPAEPLRPAMAELPLPEDFVFKPGMMVVLERRKSAAEPRDGNLKPDASVDRLTSRAGRAGDRLDVYFRTANGNLYQAGPRLPVDAFWTQYAEIADNFTMAFFGRAALPWRFADNQPVSLVFFLRPVQVPVLFEVQKARIVTVRRPD